MMGVFFLDLYFLSLKCDIPEEKESLQVLGTARINCFLMESKPGAKGDPSTGIALTSQGTVPQHLNLAGRAKCW